MNKFSKITKALLAFILPALIFTTTTTQVKADEAFNTSAKSAYLVDYASGEEIYAYNETKRLTIASMTKIMLLDIVFDEIEKGSLSIDETIIVSETASGMGGSQVFLQANGEYKVCDLVKSVIIASANDASCALAEKIAGTEEEFVKLMNQKARSMKLNDTLFSNCTGLPKPTQYSCAKDVSIMLRSLLSHDDYYRYSGIWLDEIVHPDGSRTTLTNTNKLSRFYNGCDGGKTGFTNESGFCLAATAKRDGLRLIAVVIGEDSSSERFKDVSTMLNVGFSLYENQTIVSKETPLEEKARVLGSKNEFEEVYVKEDVAILKRKNQEVDYSVERIIDKTLKAPLKKGDKVGEVVVYKNGVEYLRTDIVVNKEVKVASFAEVYGNIAANW